MADLYADENFDLPVVERLRQLGHDVLTAQEAGQAHQKISDADVLNFAVTGGRSVLTFNRRHFIRLHKQTPNHHGIIVCSKDDDLDALALRIHVAIANAGLLDNLLLRINQPQKP